MVKQIRRQECGTCDLWIRGLNQVARGHKSELDSKFQRNLRVFVFPRQEPGLCLIWPLRFFTPIIWERHRLKPQLVEHIKFLLPLPILHFNSPDFFFPLHLSFLLFPSLFHHLSFTIAFYLHVLVLVPFLSIFFFLSVFFFWGVVCLSPVKHSTCCHIDNFRNRVL